MYATSFFALVWSRGGLGLVALLALLWAIGLASVALYRITLHPLANFPGPRLAAISYSYEFWFDVILFGQYTRKIQKMHGQYGPIIRINPNELHCNDPKFISTIYTHGRHRRHKPQHFLAAFPPGFRLGIFNTADHELHQVRRSALNRFFSRSQIERAEDLIHDKFQHLCDKLLDHRNQGPLQITTAYNCCAADIITDLAFGCSTGFLDQTGWKINLKDAIEIVSSLVHITRHFPVLGYILDWMPLNLVETLAPDIGTLMHYLKVTIPRQVESAQRACNGSKKVNRANIFLELLDSTILPEAQKSSERLINEASGLVLGGTETTASALSILTYHLLISPNIREKINAELLTVVNDVSKLPAWAALEKLPYLSAVILEGLRLMYGVPGRVALIAPDEDLIYQGLWKRSADPVQVNWVIPRGYAIGMSTYLTHTDETLFPEAGNFKPGRWLNSDGTRNRDNERHFMAFSKGSRNCIGMQLAYCELYVGLAALVLRVMPHMKLYQTTEADVKYDRDEVLTRPRRGSKGVQVILE